MNINRLIIAVINRGDRLEIHYDWPCPALCLTVPRIWHSASKKAELSMPPQRLSAVLAAPRHSLALRHAACPLLRIRSAPFARSFANGDSLIRSVSSLRHSSVRRMMQLVPILARIVRCRSLSVTHFSARRSHRSLGLPTSYRRVRA